MTSSNKTKRPAKTPTTKQVAALGQVKREVREALAPTTVEVSAPPPPAPPTPKPPRESDFVKEAKSFQAMRTAGKSIDAIATETKRRFSYVEQRLSYFKLTPDAQELVKMDEIGPALCLRMSSLSPDRQNELVVWLKTEARGHEEAMKQVETLANAQ
jgi:hypothetical protein